MSILVAKGTVQSIHTREVKTVNGPTDAYSIKLGDEFYGMGFKKPKFNEGDSVEFVYKLDPSGKYRNSKSEDVEVTGHAEAPVAVSTSTTAAPTATGNKNDYWTDKAVQDLATSRRLDIVGSRNTAVNVVKAAVELDLLQMPKTKGKSFDAFLAAIDQVQRGFYLHPDNIKEAGTVTEEVVTEGDFD